jgi:cyclophilin family peptidyl-prolyl cis-trans isomerase
MSGARGRLIAGAGAAALALAAACAPSERDRRAAIEADSTPVVVLETSLGAIVMELDRRRAPQTVDHIVRHVEARFYDSLVFHRVIPNFIVQAGQLHASGQTRTSSATGVLNEARNGLLNRRGTVALARPRQPHWGAREFFINVKDNPTLNFRDTTIDGWGYAVFGRVVEGMEVVDRIAAAPTRPQGGYPNLPVTPVVITRAYVRMEETPRP